MPSNEAPRILIVEDERVVAKDIAATLRKLGYAVLPTASTAEDAVRLAKQEAPDLLLMDIYLRGELDGIEVAQAIKLERHVPVVFLTGMSDVESLQRAVPVEPLGYIVKPYNDNELQCAIEVALSRHRLELSLREREALVREMSLTDELTGLNNRRGFELLAQQQLKVARRNRQTLALFFLDVDGLKQINDELGHATGDEVLRAASRILTQTLRAPDVIARVGGDELVVLALGVDRVTAELILGRLSDNLNAFNAVERAWKLSLSTGVAIADGDEELEAFMRRADAAMYEAKRQRPNTRQRVVRDR